MDSLIVFYAFLMAVAFLAYLIKGITGFGNTLVMSPLYSFVLPNRTITPIDLLLSIPTNLFLVWKNRTDLSLKIVVPLSLVMLAGIIPGTLILKSGDDRWLKCFLGVVVIGIAVEMIMRKPPSDENGKANPILLSIIGLLSGVLAGMFGISAPLVAYISRTTDGRSGFRANLCFVFLVDNIFRFFYYLINGLLTWEVIKLTLLVLPAVAAGMYAGVKIDKRLDEQTIENIVIALLVVSGIFLIVKYSLF